MWLGPQKLSSHGIMIVCISRNTIINQKSFKMKFVKLISAVTLMFFISATNPVIAQNTDNTTTTTATTDDDDDDDNDNWGLAGLLGLLGLLGLRKRDRDDDRRTTTTVRRD